MTKTEKQIVKDLENARNLYLNSDYEKAIQIYNNLAYLLKNDTVNYPIIQIELGWSYYNNKDYEKAIDRLQSALETGTLTTQQKFDCYRIIGFSYEMLGNFKKAIEFLNTAISLNIPKKIKRFAFFELGKILFVKGSITESEKQLRIAESLFKKEESEYLATLNYYLGFTQYFQKHYIIAKKHFEYVIHNTNDFKTQASGYFGIAHIHYYQKDFEILIDICEKILRIDNEFSDKETIGYFLCEAYYHLRSWEELRSSFHELKLNYPNGRYHKLYSKFETVLATHKSNAKNTTSKNSYKQNPETESK